MEIIETAQLGRLLRYDQSGLVTCVVQDRSSGEVLMVAHMNEQAFSLTAETGELHLYSRSRQRLWKKGETSGNVQVVRAMRVDCDGDAVLVLVDPQGPACHTGNRSCFFRADRPLRTDGEVLGELERTIASRDQLRPDGSYTAKLLEDPHLARAKVSEEAAEVVEAAASETDQRLAEETADLLYHLLVLLRSRGLALDAACGVLDGRRR